ncbi:MAG: protein tyrosine phosphatase [Pseudomonadota bacterium]
MKIWISSLRDVHDAHAKANPAQVVSLLSPGSDFPSFEGYDEDRHMRVEVNDILEDMENRPAPREAHIENLIAFLGSWIPDRPLLVHCWAGMSRSTATALIAACLHNPDADEEHIGAALAAASPTAFPNTRMAAIADEMLGRGGRLAQAAKSIRDDESRLVAIHETVESKPFFIPARF